MWQSTRRKLSQGSNIARYERFLFRPAPLLEFAIVLYGVGDAVEPLREYQRHWPASRGVPAKGSGIVLSNPYLERRPGYADLEAAVRASENIKKGAFTHFRSPQLALSTSS